MDKFIEALSIGSILCEQHGNIEAQRTLLELRQKIFEGTPTVWSNRKAFRGYKGQEKTSYNTRSEKGYKKYKVIMIEEN